MKNIKEQTRKEIENIWNNKLKNEFNQKVNQGFEEILNKLDSESSEYKSNINKLFEDLDKKFDEEWNPKFNNMISELKQINNHDNNFNEVKKINNDIDNDNDDDDNNFQIFNENQNNDKNNFIEEMDDNINNNLNIELIEKNKITLRNQNFFNSNNNLNNINNVNNNNYNNYSMNSSNIQNNNNYNYLNMNNSINENNMNNQRNNNYNNFNLNSSYIQSNMNNQNNNNFNMNRSNNQNYMNNSNFNMNSSNMQNNMNNSCFNLNSSRMQNNINNQNNNNYNNFNLNNYSNINNQNNMNNQNNFNYQSFNNNNNWNVQNNINNNLNQQNNNMNLKNQNNFSQNNINNNNNFESDEFLRKQKVDFSKFNNPPLLTLLEQNNTNQLINLILRCLSNLIAILPYYFNPNKEEKILKKSKEDPNGAYLGPSFLKLLDNMWKSSKLEYCPMEMHIALKKLMGNNYFSNNPGYIMEFILNQLNNELNFNLFVNENDNDNHLDLMTSFKLFFQKFQNHQTKISNCFFTTIKTQKKCSFCNQCTYYFHMTSVVNIFLESKKEIFGFNQLNLNDHLNNLLIEEKDENENEYCSKCNNQTKKYIMREIFYAFGLIVFYINKEKDPEGRLSFDYPERFSGNMLINKDFNMHDYQLITVIKKNPNENNNFGNYIAYCKSFTNNRWYSYYKQNISLVQNTNEIIDNKNACLLIYSEIAN